MVAFVDAFMQALLDFGLAQVLTLLMMITISYAVLTKSKLLGDANATSNGKFTKKAMKANILNMTLSLILGFLVFVSPFGKAIDLWFTKFFLHILIILATVLGMYLLSGIIGFNFMRNPNADESEKKKQAKFDKIILGVAVVLILIIFTNAGGFQMFGLSRENPVIGFLNSPSTWNQETISQFAGAAVILIVFLGTLGALGMGSGIITRKPRTNSSTSQQ